MKPGVEILSKIKFPISAGNLKIVVLSIVAATTFWFFTALNKDYSATIRHSIVFDFNKDEFIATEELPDKVQINVSGVGWTIFRTGYLQNTKPIFLKVDNPERDNKIAGSNMFGTISEWLEDLELNYVLDDTLYLSVERKLSKKVCLFVDSAGINLSENYNITSPVVANLDSVELVGPRTFISNFPDTVWVYIDDDDVDTNFEKNVEIEVGNDLVTLSSPEVRISFDVEEFSEMRKSITVTKSNFPEDSLITLQDSSILISFWAAESRQGTIQDEEFLIVADFDRMVTYDSTIQPLILKYPSDIERLSIQSRRVQVIQLKDSTYVAQ